MTLTPLNKTESFMDKKKVFGLFGKLKPMRQEDLDRKGPFLIMIDEDGTGEIYKQQEPGRINHKEGHYNDLVPRKLLTIFLPDGRHFKTWIHHVKETYSYPLEPMLDSEEGHKTLTGIQANTDNLRAGRKLDGLKLWKQILKLAGYTALGIIVLWFIGDTFGFWDGINGIIGGGAEIVESTTTIAANNPPPKLG